VKCDQKRPVCDKCIKAMRPCGYRGGTARHFKTLLAPADGDTSDENREESKSQDMPPDIYIPSLRRRRSAAPKYRAVASGESFIAPSIARSIVPHMQDWLQSMEQQVDTSEEGTGRRMPTLDQDYDWCDTLSSLPSNVSSLKATLDATLDPSNLASTLLPTDLAERHLATAKATHPIQFAIRDVAFAKATHKLSQDMQDVAYTRISRHLVNPEALHTGKEFFYSSKGFVTVLRVLDKEELEAYKELTRLLRGKYSRDCQLMQVITIEYRKTTNG